MQYCNVPIFQCHNRLKNIANIARGGDHLPIAHTPPSRDRHNFLGRGFFLVVGFYGLLGFRFFWVIYLTQLTTTQERIEEEKPNEEEPLAREGKTHTWKVLLRSGGRRRPVTCFLPLVGEENHQVGCKERKSLMNQTSCGPGEGR